MSTSKAVFLSPFPNVGISNSGENTGQAGICHCAGLSFESSTFLLHASIFKWIFLLECGDGDSIQDFVCTAHLFRIPYLVIRFDGAAPSFCLLLHNATWSLSGIH